MVELNRGRKRPTPPIGFGGTTGEVTARLRAEVVAVPEEVLGHLANACPTTVDAVELAESSRDWWPLGMQWALDEQVAALASVVAKPTNETEIADVLRICNEAVIPVTATGGRSGVCGASIPLHGGVVLDMTGISGIRSVDTESLILDVGAGTFGDVLDDELGSLHGLTHGHYPQSINLSTVGGWLACRGAGQMSNRYGKIEDLVVGLDVVLADGSAVRTGGHAKAASGPDLTQVFVGSEGTLGIITGARLRLHQAPGPPRLAAYGFSSFHDANDACRRILQRGAHPAVLRVYDNIEADRSHGTGDLHALLVRNVGDDALVAAEMAIVAEECAAAERLDDEHVDRWWSHRNDVSGLEALTIKGFVVDTMEITAAWSAVDRVYEAVTSAILDLPHSRVASAHQSHAYGDGACLYFTFAARPPADEREAYYVNAWDAGTRAALAAGASLSHHHGVGLNRSRYLKDALGDGAHRVLQSLKSALDPNGILNPGKLGLNDAFGTPDWP